MTAFENFIMSLHAKLASGEDYYQELLVLKILLPSEIKDQRALRKLQRKLPLDTDTKKATK